MDDQLQMTHRYVVVRLTIRNKQFNLDNVARQLNAPWNEYWTLNTEHSYHTYHKMAANNEDIVLYRMYSLQANANVHFSTIIADAETGLGLRTQTHT